MIGEGAKQVTVNGENIILTPNVLLQKILR